MSTDNFLCFIKIIVGQKKFKIRRIRCLTSAVLHRSSVSKTSLFCCWFTYVMLRLDGKIRRRLLIVGQCVSGSRYVSLDCLPLQCRHGGPV